MEDRMETMKAVVFHGVNDLRLEEVPRPRARGRDRGARRGGGGRVFGWSEGHRRRDHTLRAVFLLPQRSPLAMSRTDGRMEVREHHQWCVGGVSPGARREG